ncbi:HNH endonuclease [Halomonas sp. McH1-25]|uniref:HNH endonuclease n=1 Tax=unclassified Halomonas TaxID=2609666 RepID=UPI001EF43929|nr:MULTISPECIES: HNH endonuclease [unclassified Halomonas]MCG7598813.1 HNH endonuclease [Halomonas sp. McH1-25]MCP1340776.1 HNH endonuclease [Halomonas sp. FL8]MCP1362199.1 HNH endonuclease [Halomonas sp. BBD45]MCP1364828.1 HNH endonuclease [Halomonas sp. BBD48]
MNITPTDIARFEAAFDRGEHEECWPWKKATQYGYGRLRIDGKVRKATRVAYLLHYGELPDDKFVCHSCDNPSCVNPHHLWLGTPKENQHDAQLKRRKPVIRNRGKKNANSVLNDLDVEIVLYLIFRGYGDKQIAARLSVSKTTIANIRADRAWVHLPRPVEVITRSRSAAPEVEWENRDGATADSI